MVKYVISELENMKRGEFLRLRLVLKKKEQGRMELEGEEWRGAPRAGKVADGHRRSQYPYRAVAGGF